MPNDGKAAVILRHLRKLVTPEGYKELSDRELLRRFVKDRDEAAFTALVGRHGPMVLSVCQRVLHHRQDAEDACQATFLVLARKATSSRWRESVANWLYEVAYRVALKARSRSRRRAAREGRAGQRPPEDPLTDISLRELQAVLDEELAHLPAKYRAPLILCCLEGTARDEAAKHLGWTVQAVKDRLEQGRELLRSKLARRGLTLSAALAGATLTQSTAQAALPLALIHSTSKAAALVVAGATATGAASDAAAALAQEISKTMFLTKVKLATVFLLGIGALAAGAGALAHWKVTYEASVRSQPEALGLAVEEHATKDDGTVSPKPATQKHTDPMRMARAVGEPGEKPGGADSYGDPLPAGAIGRLGTVCLRHVIRDYSGAACVAFSPDGKTLVSGGDVGLVAWDVATGKNLGWFPTAAPATAAQFTPDGKFLLTTDNSGSIRLWQAGTGNLLRETKQPPNDGSFHGMGSFLSADGKGAGVAGLGGVRLWETETGKPIMLRKEQGRSVFYSAAPSPDGKMLVVSGEGNRAHLLDVATGKEVRQIEGPNDAPHLQPGFSRWREESLYWFAFSPDGKSLAGVSGKDSFSVWNVADGQLRFTIKDCRGRLAFSPDGKHLACGGEEAIRLYETVTGQELRRFERHPGAVHALAFSPDGKTLASAEEYNIDLWDVATGKRLHAVAGHATPVVSLAFSPDGSELASGDSEEGALLVWNLKDRKPRYTFAGHFPNVLSLAYSPDGKILASGDGYQGSGGLDAQIRLWDLSTGRLLRQFPGHLNGVESLAFSPDGNRLASVGHDARVKVWEIATGQRLMQIRGEDAWFKSIAISPDGKTLLVASPSELAVWGLDSGRKVRAFGTDSDARRSVGLAAFLPGGRTVLTCESGDGRPKFNKARFWDAENGQLLRSVSLGDAERPLALSPDCLTLATAGDFRDPVIQLWDMTTGKRVGRFSGHNGGAAVSLAFSPDGKTLASGGRDTTVLLWEVARARLGHLWAELAGEGDKAAGAGKKLGANPEAAIPFLKDRLRRAAAAEERARRLITDLDNDKFQVREKASRELEGLGPEAALPLQLALQGSPSAEVRMRAEKVLAKIKTTQKEPDFQPRSISLAIAVLEEIGTSDARQALEELSKGPPISVVTREAGAALERLAKRRKP